MGMEHLKTNNIPLAEHFLNNARSMGKSDPLCCNELGVWAYRMKDWLETVNWFVLALRLYMEYDVASRSLGLWNTHSNEPEAKSAESANYGNDLEQIGRKSLRLRSC